LEEDLINIYIEINELSKRIGEKGIELMSVKATTKEAIQAILPITIVIILFQFTIIRLPVQDFLFFYSVFY